jgi:hypothetical protein
MWSGWCDEGSQLIVSGQPFLYFVCFSHLGDRQMSQIPSDDAWNNFVMNSLPEEYPKGSINNAAAIAKDYMSGVNHGGLYSFLTNNWELDTVEVYRALNTVGASIAARELKRVLDRLGVPVPASSQDERGDLLERFWTDKLNELDSLSDEADKDLMNSLENHVHQNEEFYLSLE